MQPVPDAITLGAMKPGRNDPCRCGSGNKYKKCCLPKDEAARSAELAAERARSSEAQAAEGAGPDRSGRAAPPAGAKPPPQAPAPPPLFRRRSV